MLLWRDPFNVSTWGLPSIGPNCSSNLARARSSSCTASGNSSNSGSNAASKNTCHDMTNYAFRGICCQEHNRIATLGPPSAAWIQSLNKEERNVSWKRRKEKICESWWVGPTFGFLYCFHHAIDSRIARGGSSHMSRKHGAHFLPANQLDSKSKSSAGTEGWGFESLRARQG